MSVKTANLSSFPHIRATDSQRYLLFTLIALMFPLAMAIFNNGWHRVLPMIAMSYMVGGIWEILFARIKKRQWNNNFLITALIFPLMLPAATPLWQVALGISFGVVIGNELFGGEKVNALNPALIARAFLFFICPIAPLGPIAAIASSSESASIQQIIQESNFTWMDCFLGLVPGGMGDTSSLACLIGAAILLVTRTASWRIMTGMFLGAFACVTALNLIAGPNSGIFLKLPFHYHAVLGGFMFGLVYVATEPVSGPSTGPSKWIYGAGIGILCILIRSFNPFYSEAIMLSILLMNAVAPILDHVVLWANIHTRLAVESSR